jgi:hypothetical protein
MKTKNNLTTGILIGIGMIVIPLIIMSSKPISPTNNEVVCGTPQNHVWKGISDGSNSYIYNTVTGEVRGLGINVNAWKLQIR